MNQFKIELPLKIEYDRKYEKVERIFRIESDKFKICESQIIKKRKQLVSEEVFVVHFSNKGKFTIEKLE